MAAGRVFRGPAHQHQFRKDGRTPYIAHPLRVALTVRHVFEIDDPTARIAAVLHDTLEDTTTDYDDLFERFGRDVADAVAALNERPAPSRAGARSGLRPYANRRIVAGAGRETGRRVRQLL
ncbi:MAG: HD domain-containing protein [Pirellulales bacterium]